MIRNWRTVIQAARRCSGGAEIASTGKRKYGKYKYETGQFAGVENASTENVSIPVNTKKNYCRDYNGTPIACRMSVSLSWFLCTWWPQKWHHFCTP